ncbi:DUF3500 domain-containing protein [Roseibacillus persicicus]|uniref:DUF3500 domain-containing protein n=1 Tax=Roseibacillus persicicus TaxID=454148 RepID=A0A918WG50_9BACT|nr:DUF3500 domain-containing protein [Roseibacillus persicicus]GHC43899.1 hypothetical protein GCM10007100_06360 [Roseibacillus persicicus]
MRAVCLLLLSGSLTLFADTPVGSAQVKASALKFLGLLNEEQKEKATFDLTDEERENWHYVPLDRAGLRLDAMDETQQKAAHELLGQSLSAQGHATAKQVIQQEMMLYEKSNQSEYRNPGKYTVAIFGTPSAEKPWGWRFEGHHLSLNFTIAEEKVVLTTPFFFGTNPAEVREGPHKGMRPLGKIEDAARSLARKLHQEGKHVRFTNEPPKEIISAQDRVAKKLNNEGVTYSELGEAAKKEFLVLTQLIASSQRKDFLNITTDSLNEAYFGWAGEFDAGEAHYFRIQSPQFLIEYANIQNGANHAHLVWRDFDGDFGRNVLKEHLDHAH